MCLSSLRSLLLSDRRIRSVVTFDRGGEWRLIHKPQNVDCVENTRNVRKMINSQASISHLLGVDNKNLCVCVIQCYLHIHGEHSRVNGITAMLPLSDPLAVGLVIAHGNPASHDHGPPKK